MMHKLEVLFNREFTLEEVELLQDTLMSCLMTHELDNKIELIKTLDIVITDSQ